MTKVEEIVAQEWVMFDQVHNIGGRASCQDDRTTFEIMRSSQLLAWSEEMLDSYAGDLRDAKLSGRNLLAEKYGYMMERTSPAEFERIREALPPISAEKRALIDHICAAHMVWWKELNEAYPILTGRGRSGNRKDDGVAGTSFETYLRGELATYSRQTLERYWAHVQQLQGEGKSLNRLILEHTVRQYGWNDLDEAEQKLSGI